MKLESDVTDIAADDDIISLKLNIACFVIPESSKDNPLQILTPNVEP